MNVRLIRLYIRLVVDLNCIFGFIVCIVRVLEINVKFILSRL